MSAATETVVGVDRKVLDEALVALIAAERFFEHLADECVPPPWELFTETFTQLYLAAHGTMDADPNDENSDFSSHYYEIERRGIAQARKGWKETWEDCGELVVCVPRWTEPETAAA